MILTVLGIAAVFGGITQSCLGFGFALVLTPLALLFLPPTAVVPMVVLMSLVNSGLAAVHARKSLQIPLLLPLVAAGMAGFSSGVAVLVLLDPTLLRLAIGLFVSLFAVTQMSGWRRPFRESYAVLGAVGLVSGFAGGATSIAGPPLALFLSNQKTPARIFRANLLAFYFAMNAWGLLNHLYAGLLTPEVLIRAAVCIPGTILGTVLGILLAPRMTEQVFQRVVLLFALVTGALLVLTALQRLFTA